MIAKFDQVYIAAEAEASRNGTDDVGMYCDLCGKRVMGLQGSITLAEAMAAAVMHQAAEHP